MERIEIRGARTHLLRDVDVDLPKRALTVVTGVSGSGKSSLVVDTLAAESRRLLNETFSAFAQIFLPTVVQPDVDSLAHLPPVVVIDQEPPTSGPRSTVGTATDVVARLRLLFASMGEPRLGPAHVFGFNDPAGMCPTCRGLGHERGAGHDVGEGAPCPDCRGTRVNDAVRSCRIEGWSVADLCAMQADELLSLLTLWDYPQVAPLLEVLREQLRRLLDLGLGYLSLDRATSTLSGGEAQRVAMVRHLASSLSDLLYVVDEPTTGLHARDVGRLGEVLLALRDTGSTVVVVEHHPAIMEIADHVVELGPGAGRAGGRVTFTGTFWDLVDSRTTTGEALRARVRGTRQPRRSRGTLRIEDAATHNLQHVTVEIPLGVMTAVTGVAGSGKSTLVRQHLVAVADDVVVIDQRPLRASRRSSVATYAGVLDPVRALFARVTGAPAALFSPGAAGGCPACHGMGTIVTDLGLAERVTSRCEVCEGRRFNQMALQHRVGRRSVADVLALTVSEALDFFAGLTADTVLVLETARGVADVRRVVAALERLVDVGLDYVELGQSLPTLSGGERQRLKLAVELVAGAGRGRRGTPSGSARSTDEAGRVYLLDEPTAGLHMADVGRLIELLDRLVDQGGTVVVVEHDLDVVAAADWVIDLGPDAGNAGGRVMFEGTPDDLAHEPTPTGEHLRRHLTAPVR